MKCSVQLRTKTVTNINILPLLFFLLFSTSMISPALAQSKNVVLAVDLGILPENSAEERDAVFTELLRENIAPGDSLAVMVFGESAQLLQDFTAHDLLTAGLFGDLPVTSSPSGLMGAMELATVLFNKLDNGGEDLLLLVTTGGDELGWPVMNSCFELQQRGVRTRIFLPWTSPQAELPVSEGFAIEVKMLPAAGSGVAATLAQIREIAAQAAGVEMGDMVQKARLAEDFGFDPMKVYELTEMVCATFGIEPPRDFVPTTLEELADYVLRHRARAKVSAVEAGGRGPTCPEEGETAPSYASTRAVKAYFEQTIFYATNRKATGKKDPSGFYGGERAAGGKLAYGKCLVTIPLTHKKGAVETPFLGLKFLENASEHILLADLSLLTREEFIRQVRSGLQAGKGAESWESDTVLFIHGFNVTFADAAKRTAQMAHDFGFKGAPLMFSWPSAGKLYAYLSDREDIIWSVAHIEEFLDEVVEKIRPSRIHLVAHSMGNQGLIGALNMLALRRGPDQRPLFENIILAAPDFDAQLFQEQIAPRVKHLAKRWTIYASDKDAALNISSTINSTKRLGLPVTSISGVDVIDATGIDVTPWSVPEFHSYYATKQTVIQDIISTIKGYAPSTRQLLPRVEDQVPYWRLGIPEIVR